MGAISVQVSLRWNQPQPGEAQKLFILLPEEWAEVMNAISEIEAYWKGTDLYGDEIACVGLNHASGKPDIGTLKDVLQYIADNVCYTVDGTYEKGCPTFEKHGIVRG